MGKEGHPYVGWHELDRQTTLSIIQLVGRIQQGEEI